MVAVDSLNHQEVTNSKRWIEFITTQEGAEQARIDFSNLPQQVLVGYIQPVSVLSHLHLMKMKWLYALEDISS